MSLFDILFGQIEMEQHPAIIDGWEGAGIYKLKFVFKCGDNDDFDWQCIYWAKAKKYTFNHYGEARMTIKEIEETELSDCKKRYLYSEMVKII